MLRSRDFNAQAALDEQMRWWHNRALHRAFGVRLGLEVSATISPANQLIGVRVSEGVAYDCFGRELVLCPGQDITLPEIWNVDKALLVLRRKETVSKRSECGRPSCRTKRQDTELVWKLPGQCDAADGVPLARIVLRNRIFQVDSLFIRPMAHALARPRVANGATLPGKTAWEELSLANGLGWGLQTHIDTTAAGFTQMPAYFAWLAITSCKSGDELPALKLLNLPTDIVETTSAGFTFRILLARNTRIEDDAKVAKNRKDSFTLYARKLGWRVCWLGCEHLPEAPVCRDECDCDCPEEFQSQTLAGEKENNHAH